MGVVDFECGWRLDRVGVTLMRNEVKKAFNLNNISKKYDALEKVGTMKSIHSGKCLYF